MIKKKDILKRVFIFKMHSIFKRTKELIIGICFRSIFEIFYNSNTKEIDVDINYSLVDNNIKREEMTIKAIKTIGKLSNTIYWCFGENRLFIDIHNTAIDNKSL